ncbi:conserved Plasmodium protein, unknown function [Plasmodium gallinaceum]|uniref:RAP domain-containing protein n=1 Tax=Plasmodium gallinaceum TaxID=5849 RepID=A0A1J1GMZ5_PLAGA|nr:conserved Plasmodium protein, unknown function [Plasmodium gallinaceum]CRG93793.1 conserved Plasmodium protein, unknown function [Plasmodium gallinaceum]
MKIFFIGNFSRFNYYSTSVLKGLYNNSICNHLKKKLFLRNFISINEEDKYNDNSNKQNKENDIVDDIYIQKQKDFVNKFEEENYDKEEYSTVRILNKNETSNDFLLNNEKYINFIEKYNYEKMRNNKSPEKKNNRFSQNVLENDEKSLWEILKEKEDYLRNKKKLKAYQKDIDHKMSRESEKIKKEEKFIELDQNKKKNREQLNSDTKIKNKKKNNMKDIHDDIDLFLKNDETYVNDIKSYDEIYEDSSKRISENNKNEKLEEENCSNNKINYEKDDLNINNIIQEDFKYHNIYDEINKYNNEQKKLTSDILINDLNSPNNINSPNVVNNLLFVEETDHITAKRCLNNLSKENGLMKNDDINKKSESQKDAEIKKGDVIKNNSEMEGKNVIKVESSEIIKRLSGESLSTIIDGNIDNLIIQREIKKEKTVNGIISVVYNNLHNCDNINLSSALLKISKLIDSYQKQSIIKNYMYLCILKKIEENLSLFEISNLVQIFYAFVKIDHLPFFFNCIINLINEKINEIEAKHICSILYTLSNIIIETNESRNLKNKIIDIIKSNISMFVCLNDVICLLTALSKLKYKDVNTYYQLSKKIEENLDQLSMKNISNILWSFSNVNYTCKLVKKVKKIIEKNIHDSSYLDVINIIYSLTKLNEYDDYLYNDVFYNAINIYIHNMSIKNLCIILWSYTFANVDKPDLYINILTKINENMKHISSKDVVSILTCLSRIKFNYRYKHLFNHLKNKVIKNLYAFTPLQLTNVIYHSSFLDIYDHKYYYLLVQQIYQIRKLLYLENLTLILYSLKNIYYLNVKNLDVFKLISYILEQIKKKYKLLYGEDCINIMLIINDLMKYTNQGYLNFSYISEYKNMDNKYYLNTLNNENESYANNYVDIFNDNVNINQLNIESEEEVYLPYINDLLYEQIKIRLNNFWQLSIKDVNNLLIILKNGNIYDDVIINMIMRQIIPILLKSSNIEFLIFLSNITANRNLKFIALTHLSRRPKLISVFKKKINSITQNILNNYGEDENDYSIYNNKQLINNSDKECDTSHNEKNKEEKRNIINNEELKNSNNTYKDVEGIKENINNFLKIKYCNNEIVTNNSDIELNYDIKKRSKIDINSCIALCYACFNIHYEDDNILKLYDVIEHMIIEEKKPINSFMLINFLYVLTLTNNKMDLVRKLSEEYMNHRYSYDIEQNNLNLYNEQHNDSRHEGNEIGNVKSVLSFNLFYDSNDKLSSYIQKGDEDISLLLLKLLYVNILLNKYNYLYHILSEICKYYDDIYSYEFIMLSKQVCYHIYNFSNFFCKNKDMHHIWNKVLDNVYINEENIYLDLNYEKTNVNLIDEKDNKTINFSLNNKKICKSLDNNMNIAKFFYYILNYNIDDINNRNINYLTSKKEKKKIKMFHFDHIISDILNFLNIQYKGSYIHENIYKICCSFPYERHLIDLLLYEDVLFPSNRPLLSSELRQKQLALKGWTVHSLNFRDIYNSIKDKNIICYIFNICKKIKKDLNSFPNNEKIMEEKEFWENIKYANI